MKIYSVRRNGSRRIVRVLFNSNLLWNCATLTSFWVLWWETNRINNYEREEDMTSLGIKSDVFLHFGLPYLIIVRMAPWVDCFDQVWGFVVFSLLFLIFGSVLISPIFFVFSWSFFLYIPVSYKIK